jgi:nucleoside-diphosphate-sugar epimerase
VLAVGSSCTSMTSSPQYWAPCTRRASIIFAFNVSGGAWLSEQAIVAQAAPALPGLQIAPTPAPARCLDGEMGPLDTARAEAAFGFSPRIPLAEGIAAYAAALR